MNVLSKTAKLTKYLLFVTIIFVLLSCQTNSETLNETTSNNTKGDKTFKMEAWADNWFAVYLDETLIVEDSVPITTERSFNSESVTFKASYPLHLNFVLKDFKENDTGLEYIGSNRQQMGDGGFIMQLTDTSSGKVITVSDENFKCIVIHEAPLDKSCEKESSPIAGTKPCEFKSSPEPDGWKTKAFDDSKWKPASVFSAAQVSPKDGYNAIKWDSSGKIYLGR